MRLGECAKERGKLDDAIALWNEAKQIDPTDAGVRAHLGDAYAKKRDREKAVRELKEAERLDPEDASSEQIVWQGYAALHETPLALEHLEKFVALARKEGLAPRMVDYMEACGRELKARLTPNEITADLPTIYTRQSLDAALRERLTPAEYKLVINPLCQHTRDGPLGAGADPRGHQRPGPGQEDLRRADAAPGYGRDSAHEPPRKCSRLGTIRRNPFAARNTPGSTSRSRGRWA